MALLRYLQVLPHGQLPDPMGALLSSLPSSAIAEANAAVTIDNIPPSPGLETVPISTCSHLPSALHRKYCAEVNNLQ